MQAIDSLIPSSEAPSLENRPEAAETEPAEDSQQAARAERLRQLLPPKFTVPR